MKTVCLFGPNLPPFFVDANPASEALETCAIDLWHAGFGVLVPHLNAPRADGLKIPSWLQLSFDAAAIRKFSDAVFVMPGWESDDSVWARVALAEEAGKSVFESLEQIVRWREGKPHVTLKGVFGEVLWNIDLVRPIKIVFVVGKYFVGEKKGDIWVPDRNAIHENILGANRVAVTLWNEGIGAFTPHNNTHHFELKTRIGEPIYQEFDQLLLERFTEALVVLPSWVNSTGAPKEVAKAQGLGRLVIDAYDLKSIRNWRDGKGSVNVIATVLAEK
ncbi:MAG: hypothetical protein Q7R91_02465 [bacterium]|nr:hypothetical protein [bacterium]